MMKIAVDSQRCSGHARCYAVAPKIFTIDEYGYCNIGASKDVDDDDVHLAIEGISVCPEDALYVVD
jgi:ferredoxin